MWSDRHWLDYYKSQFQKRSNFTDDIPDDYNKVDNDICIKQILFKKPYTIVLFTDGSKTVTKCHEKDTYDEVQGVMCCIMKKMFGEHYYGRICNIIRKQHRMDKKEQDKKEQKAKKIVVAKPEETKQVSSEDDFIKNLKNLLKVYTKSKKDSI